MTETMNTMDDKRIASEEDLLTIDASTGEKTYRYITREDVNHLEAETAENGGYPPTQNGDIRSLFWLFSLMALQN